MMKFAAYTVGNTESYTKAMREGPIFKAGRNNGDPNAYDGGSVFRTKDAAQEFIDNNNYPYSVYGLELPNGWEQDIDETKEEEEGFCRLLHDAKIIAVPRLK